MSDNSGTKCPCCGAFADMYLDGVPRESFIGHFNHAVVTYRCTPPLGEKMAQLEGGIVHLPWAEYNKLLHAAGESLTEKAARLGYAVVPVGSLGSGETEQ